MATADLLGFVPLLVVTLLVLPVALLPFSSRANVLVARIALPLFDRAIPESGPTRRRQTRRLRAAFVGESYRVFAAQTLFISGVAGIAGSVYGVYGAAFVLRALAVGPDAIRAALPTPLHFLTALASVPNLSLLQLFGLLLLSGATLGSLFAVGAYWLRWAVIDQRAHTRKLEIDATLPRTVAFVYALSRSGVPFQEVLRTLADNQDVYGEAAREFSIAVREMDAFGTDILTALHETASRTPSTNLEEFAENLASVLSSGQSVSTFLRDQYDRFQEEAQAQQRQYLELLATFAEVYVTALVAGPLFFITVLVVVGLVIQNTLTLLRLVGYVAIPLATVGFLVYVDSVTEGLNDLEYGTGHDTDEDPKLTQEQRVQSIAGDEDEPGSGVSVSPPARRAGLADGGTVDLPSADGHTADENWRRLAIYDRVRWLRETVSDPVETVLREPGYSLVVTGPIGLVLLWLLSGSTAWDAVTGIRTGAMEPSVAVAQFVRAVDGPLILATIVVFGGVSVAHEIQKRRLRGFGGDMPDFLDRMASINEAGVTVVGCLERLSTAELGKLGDEITRVWRDIQWGASVSGALARMQQRTNAPIVARAVTLIRNAMAASGDISPVLHIAADEAQQARRLRRERRQEMLTYLVVIYVSFFVFLGIVAALTVSFIPAIEAAGQSTDVATEQLPGINTGVITGLQTVNTNAYELLFFHVAAVQGVCSGLVAGQLGEGRVSDGLKHATVLLGVTLVVFTII